ncbi:MAG: oxidoreductase [Bacteroidetes bacterium QS_8_64_10]|nr:MAG: oxidoreductase [Bacteroidetes bacterium QS_8_64_10]
MALNRTIRYGMVGGGPSAFIGEVHRRAARLDGEMELTAGAFSSYPDKSRRMGRELHLAEDRVYGSYDEMAECEAALPDDERIDVVSIVTPNHLHFEVARTFIERGFHVVCDKPLTTTLEDAEALCRLVSERDVVFALTHSYAGYPMVKQARELVHEGELGEIRKVVAEYPQGWLATALEKAGDKQAAWRTDPERAGVSAAIGDIGSHAEHLARYVTGLNAEALFAETTSFVEGRALEDDATILVRYEGGARGLLYCSQVSVGEKNSLRLRVYGTKASLDWQQEAPNQLAVRYADAPDETHERGGAYLAGAAQANARLPVGHPEGFIEAFANVYRAVAADIAARSDDGGSTSELLDYPTVRDGALGVHFIHKAIESAEREKWVDVQYAPPFSG